VVPLPACSTCFSVEENASTAFAAELIESIGQEKAKVDEEVEKGREDEEAAASLQAEVTAFAGGLLG